MARPSRTFRALARLGVGASALAGKIERRRDEMMLHLSARAEALAVGGRLDARAEGAAPLAGRGFFEAVHVADRPALLAALADSLESATPGEARLRLMMSAQDAPAAFAWVRLDLFPAQADAGAFAMARLTPGDARAPADSDRFLANVSHELRTPLNAILGFSELLADRELAPRDPDKRREYARIIHESATHLLALVNLVLDASKVEAGKFELNPEPFPLRPLIESCCDMLRLKATAGGVSLSCGPLDSLGLIEADKRAVKQIIANLLSNAVKFTPRGGEARISASREGAEIVLTVEDTGVGIARELLARIGEPFFQAHADYDRHFEGAGLGLSLVRGLVGLHGGAVRIQSAPGKGTRVIVRLPAGGVAIGRIGGPIEAEYLDVPNKDRELGPKERKIA